MQASSRINNMLKKGNYGKNHVSNVKIGSGDDVWYTEYRDTTIVNGLPKLSFEIRIG